MGQWLWYNLRHCAKSFPSLLKLRQNINITRVLVANSSCELRGSSAADHLRRAGDVTALAVAPAVQLQTEGTMDTLRGTGQHPAMQDIPLLSG